MGSFGWLGFNSAGYSRKQNRQGIGVMAGGKLTARPLGAASGITSPCTLSVTSTVWTVGSFTALCDLESDATMGPTSVVSDGNQTGPVTAASGSFDRYDLLYLTLDDATALEPVILYVAGTVATTLPATPSEAMPFAQITVPKSGTGSPTVTLIAPRAAAVGGILQVASSAAYPDQPYVGQAVYDVTLGRTLVYTSASGWQQYATSAARTELGNASVNVPNSNFILGITSYAAGSFNVGDVSYAGGIFTIVTPGIYLVSASWNFVPAASDGVWRFTGQFLLNSVAQATGQSCLVIDTSAWHGLNTVDSTSGQFQCSAGDTIQLGFSKSGTGAVVPTTATAFSITRVA